jgi:hypothetical protein
MINFSGRAFTAVILAFATVAGTAGAANAVGLRQVIRDCGDDGKAFCDGVGYGAPMQACLARNYRKLTPACKQVMDRLNKGESVEILG